MTTTTKKLTQAQWLVLDTIATEGGWTHMDADAYRALVRPEGEEDRIAPSQHARSAKRAAVMKTTRGLEERGLLVRFDYIRRQDGAPTLLRSGSGIALTEEGYAALKRTAAVVKLATLVYHRDGLPDTSRIPTRLLLSDLVDERVISKWFHGDAERGIAWKIDRTAPNAAEAVAVVEARIAAKEAEKARDQAMVDAAWDEAKAYDATLPRGTLATAPNLSWAPEVIADDSGKWCGNALRFATKEEAEANVWDLSMRWMLVRDTRVVESTDPVNYQWSMEVGLVSVKKEAV